MKESKAENACALRFFEDFSVILFFEKPNAAYLRLVFCDFAVILVTSSKIDACPLENFGVYVIIKVGNTIQKLAAQK